MSEEPALVVGVVPESDVEEALVTRMVFGETVICPEFGFN